MQKKKSKSIINYTQKTGYLWASKCLFQINFDT